MPDVFFAAAAASSPNESTCAPTSERAASVSGASAVIGIVTRNRAGILPQAINSALKQGGINVRVAVLDDGSSDRTSELAKEFPMLSWTRWEHNQGYLAARNYLMQSANEDYYVSLDDDAWFMENDELAIAVDYMERNPTTAAVGFDILSPDRPAVIQRSDPEPAAMYIGCGHVLRLAAVRTIGLYAAMPGAYGGEEKDLCLRLLDAGYQIVRLPGVHVWHDKTPVARDLPAQHRSGVCNDLVMTLRRTPSLLLPVALPTKMVRHLRFSWRRKLIGPCLSGFSLFARSVPAAWRSRHPVKTATLKVFLRLLHAGTRK